MERDKKIWCGCGHRRDSHPNSCNGHCDMPTGEKYPNITGATGGTSKAITKDKSYNHIRVESRCSADNELAYPIQVRLLNRFHELYEAGKVDYGYPKGFVEYFAIQHFLLDEVIKAYQRGQKDGSEQKNHET